MSNNNSIWFAVDGKKREWLFQYHPVALHNHDGVWVPIYKDQCIELPLGSIKAITGKILTWADEPIEWNPGVGKFDINEFIEWQKKNRDSSYVNIFDIKQYKP